MAPAEGMLRQRRGGWRGKRVLWWAKARNGGFRAKGAPARARGDDGDGATAACGIQMRPSRSSAGPSDGVGGRWRESAAGVGSRAEEVRKKKRSTFTGDVLRSLSKRGRAGLGTLTRNACLALSTCVGSVSTLDWQAGRGQCAVSGMDACSTTAQR
jgi:hypothetical protein